MSLSSSVDQQNTPAGQEERLSDSLLEGRHTALVLRTRLRIAANAIRNIRSHLYLHAFVGFGLVFFLLGGGTGLFHFLFSFLMRQPVFGPPLMDRLVGIVLLIFFCMLLFSNLIITLSTTYISKEVDFLMALPLSRQSIFRQKLVESIFYSSWAFAILSMPLFVSYGITRDAVWYYYPLILLLIVPFLVIPAALGAIVTMVLTAFLPARRTRSLCFVLGGLALALMFALAKVTGIGQLLADADQRDILQIMATLGFGDSPFLPSGWLSMALHSIAPVHHDDINLGNYLYWFAMLVSTALFLVEASSWLVPSLYYRGWCLSKDSAHREVETSTRLSPFQLLDSVFNRFFSQPNAALLSKDLKSFWRDPAQWTQLVILFGLMIIYVLNLGWSQRYNETIAMVVDDWKTVLTFFNLAATCFILSILTTRFIYPMLSLEGRGFWTVGLAPIYRSQVVWQKSALCLLLCFVVAMPLMALSNRILQVETFYAWLSYGVAAVMSFGLTSLSVGIGALLPDFREDNPARIANGVGGTLNVILSLAYITFTVIQLLLPVVVAGHGEKAQQILETWIIPYIALCLIIQLLIIYFPIRIGLKRWEKLEF